MRFLCKLLGHKLIIINQLIPHTLDDLITAYSAGDTCSGIGRIQRKVVCKRCYKK